MRSVYAWIILILFFISNIVHASNVPGTLERHLKNNHSQVYLVYLPQDFNPEKSYPLLIAVHWLGGTAREILENWYHFTNRDKYILLCPQFNGRYEVLADQEDKALLSIMDEATHEFHYNPDKVYLMGCSGGAQFVHRFVFKHPERIKAAAIIAAGNYTSPPADPKIAKVKFFVGVGENDFQRLGITKEFYQELLNQGYDAKFEIFPDMGHGCGVEVQDSVAQYFKELK